MSKFSTAAIALLLAATSAPPGLRAAESSSAVVHVRGFAFSPSVLVVDAGTTVTVVNDDAEAHTLSAVDKSFDSEGLDAHQSWKHVFSKAGSYAYYCELHPYMKGKIVVRAAVGAKP